MTTPPVTFNDTDAWVDDEILSCLNPDDFKSFFLFAGAGSGKTRTLVNVLTRFKEKWGELFRLQRRTVAIITYTNAAANEIVHRLEYDPIFQVSTINSFAWNLIRPFTADIRNWLKTSLSEDLDALVAEQSKSKNLQNKTSKGRAIKMEYKSRRLGYLDDIQKFTYNPNGDELLKDSLNHAEVIGIAASFIRDKQLMQQLICCKYPILLIDESQDTKKELVDSVFSLYQSKPTSVCIGLFGDTMQRIYADGKEDLHTAFPKEWKTPEKKLNHRSAKRIITLINNIRVSVDGQQQEPRTEKEHGFVRLFLCNRGSDKTVMESKAIERMAEITGDTLWNGNGNNVKILILEHHMAARRMGFFEFFDPLYRTESLRAVILQGTHPALVILSKVVLPLLRAHRAGDTFEIGRIIRKESPMLSSALLRQSKDSVVSLRRCKEATEALLGLWAEGNDPSISSVIRQLYRSGLLAIPESLRPIAAQTDEELNVVEGDAEEDGDEELMAWGQALAQPFSQIEKYDEYLSERSRFGTHQGVKGLQFPRVLVIVDDEEAKGFMFSYDKLFGTKALSPADLKNIADGKETHIDRTRRLFYVCCSRAQESLAIVEYSEQPEEVKRKALEFGWFADSEVELIR